MRDAFIQRGHEAISCDLLPSSSTRNVSSHYQGDVRDLLKKKWDAIIAFPPCRYLCSSGMHWTIRGLRDPALTEAAKKFVLTIWNAQCDRIAIENPVGVSNTAIGKPDRFSTVLSRRLLVTFATTIMLTVLCDNPPFATQPKIRIPCRVVLTVTALIATNFEIP